MNRITLGRTGLKVSPIAFGTWQLGGDWGQFDQAEALAAIVHARTIGINFFDTAQAYGFGASERLLGQALQDELSTRRGEIVIATKGGLRMTDQGLVRDSSPDWLGRGVEQSLEALGVEHIDLYQIHWPDPGTPFAETAQALADLRQQGKIGHIGVSNFTAEQIEEFSRTLEVDAVQPPYHMFRREIESELLPYAAAHDIGVLIYGPLAHGLLTGSMSAHTSFAPDDWRGSTSMFRGETLQRNLQVVTGLTEFAAARNATVAQLAIAWTLANPAVHVAIVGARSARHIAECAAAAEIHLSAEEMEEIDRITAPSVALAGPTPEGMP